MPLKRGVLMCAPSSGCSSGFRSRQSYLREIRSLVSILRVETWPPARSNCSPELKAHGSGFSSPVLR